MRIPRWATYPAIAILLIVAVIALPRVKKGKGAAREARDVRRVELATAARVAATRHTVVDFLPAGYVTDGSVDYRKELQTAIEASGGATLELPNFAIRVDRAPGRNYALLVRGTLTIEGTAGSLLRTESPAMQILRGEDVQGLMLSNFGFQGVGGHGEALGHGLLQITGGQDVQIRNLTIRDADADGLAVSRVTKCIIEDVVVTSASKAGIYLADCSDALVRNNLVSDFGGHKLSDGTRVGIGIQLSSSRNVLCSDNVIQDGLGVGILCNAFQDGPKPFANALRDNQICSVSNPDNVSVSGGIRLANGNADRVTRTHVSRNTIWSCGANGIFVENHGDSDLLGNLINGSDRAGILIGHIEGLRVTRNVVMRSGSAQDGEDQPIATLGGATGIQLEANVTQPAGGEARAGSNGNH